MVCSIAIENKIIASKVSVANHFKSRLFGLMYKKKLDDNSGLLLTPCTQVHTFFMHFPIDVLFLSQDNEILSIQTLPPWKVSYNIKECKKILELCSGVAGVYDLKSGMILQVEANPTKSKADVNGKEKFHVES